MGPPAGPRTDAKQGVFQPVVLPFHTSTCSKLVSLTLVSSPTSNTHACPHTTLSSLSACTVAKSSLDLPSHFSPQPVIVLKPKASVLTRALVAAWKEMLPAPSNDDCPTGKPATPAVSCLDEVVPTNHEWSEHGVSIPHAPNYVPHALNFTGARDNLLRAPARLLTEHVYSKPLTTLYDPGYSGEILLSDRIARKLGLTLDPIDQPIVLADGSTVACTGIARGVTFAPTDTFCEIVDVLVFPLSNYDVLVGMAWLAAHDADISCKTKHIRFWPRDCTLHTPPNSHVVSCLLASHADTACVIEAASLQMVTCNQFKKFLAEDPDVERCAVFFSLSDDNALPLLSVEPDLSKAQAQTNIEITLDTLHTRSDLPPPVRTAFCDMLQTFSTTVFADREYSSLEDALSRTVQHEIHELPHDEKPCRPVYRLSPPMLDELRAQITALLAAGIIRPSMSPYGAPVLFARKKDGTWRMCIDYRALNKITVKDKFPIPRAEDLFDQVQGAQFFTKIDLRWGYYQIKMRAEDVHKTAFRTPLGSFEWLCMPFGLTNAPATFQRFVQDILHPFLGTFACVYIDDILVYSRTAEEHVEHVRRVLEVLQHHKLLAKPTKCEWFTTEVEYLGHRISGKGIAVDDAKVRVLREWAVPSCKADVRSFLGLANYYRRFIPHFAHITSCLNELMHDKVPDAIPWEPRHQHAFDTLKTALTNAPVLRTYDRNLKCTVITDASSSRGAIGAVLMQDDGAGARPIAYFSRKMTSAERNYPTREQELLAVRDALLQWKHYLLGISFSIHSDHESLKYLFSQKELSGRLLRWCDFLQQFDFGDIQYLPGERNPVGDALSRPPTGDAHPAGALASLLLSSHVTPHTDVLYNVELSMPTSHLHDLIRDHLPGDTHFGPVLEKLMDEHFDAATSPLRNRFSLHNGLLYWHGTRTKRICVPDAMRKVLLKEAHDAPLMGHMGIDRTHTTLAREYYWPRMHRDIRDYVNSCTTCQQSKASHEHAAGLARPLPVPDHPFETWGLDFIIMPASASGKNCIVVFVCHKSKKVHAIPATMTGNAHNPLSAKAVARIYFDHIVKHYGLCSAIVSDRDRRFVSVFWKELHKLCGTALHMSTAFHPQTDGLTERENRTVIQTLSCILRDLGGDWEDHLTSVEFAMNNAVNASTGVSPFYMTLGRHPRTPLTFDVSSCDVPAAGAFLDRIQSVLRRSEDSMLRAQIAQVDYMDRSRRISPFKVGDMVWLSARNIKFDTPNKFAPKYVGPYRILKLHGHGNAAKLDIPATFRARRIHDVFNVSLLKPYVERPADLGKQRLNRPPPLMSTDEGDFWEVERVLKVEIRENGQRMVQVRWKGWGEDEDSWEPYDRFKKDCPEALREWHILHPE